jgi:hypothetical protein
MKGRMLRRSLCLIAAAVPMMLLLTTSAMAQDFIDPVPSPGGPPIGPPGGPFPEPPPGPSDEPPTGPPTGPPTTSPGGPPTGPPGGPPSGPPSGPVQGEERELLEAGGELPPPQAPGTEDESDDTVRFPTWRIAGMILSASVFGFALYRLVGTSWVHRYFFGPG